MDRDAYMKSDSWLGSYYELCLELGPAGNDQRLKNAIRTLWSHPTLAGPWADQTRIGREREQTDGGDLLRPLCGVVSIDRRVELGCVSHVVREDDGSDWLDLCVPTGMLELVFSVAYPMERESNPWMSDLDRLFARIGAAVFREVGFELAVIGEEASGIVSARKLTAEDLEGRVLLLPSTRWDRLATAQGTVLVDGLMAVGLQGPV